MKPEILRATSEFVAGTLDVTEKMAADLSAFETAQETARTKSAALASTMRRLGLIQPHEEKQAADMICDPAQSADMMEIFLAEYEKVQSQKSASADPNVLGHGSGGHGVSNPERELSASDLCSLKAAGLA